MGGTIPVTSPPNRATSLMAEERSTDYFWSVGRKMVSMRGFSDRFISDSSNS